MTTALRITAGIFALISGILWHFDFPSLSLFFAVIAIFILLASLFMHRNETKKSDMKVDTPTLIVDPNALVVSKLSHPDLRVLDHRYSVIGCLIANTSGQKATITEVKAYDNKGADIKITWSNHIDDFGNPINPYGLIVITDKESLFIKRNDGKNLEFCRVEIFHSFSDSALTVTFDEYADGWKL